MNERTRKLLPKVAGFLACLLASPRDVERQTSMRLYRSIRLTSFLFVVLAAFSPQGFSQSLPSGWLDQDVGAVGSAGSATYANGVFTVKGAGTSGLWSTADGFHFVYQQMTGDGSVVARITSITSTASSTGVQMRESLDPSSKGAYLYSYNNGIGLNYRSTTGGVASNPASMSVTLPYWVKLTRSGNTVTAYTSVNGSSWSPLGSPLTISMANTIYVGLGTASGNTTSLATGTLDSVSVSSTASPAPLISSVSATTGSIGSQVVILGSGFGATQGSSLVTINNVPMTVSGWNSSQITATVATGTTTGPLVVSVAPSMNDSKAISITLTSNPLPPGWLDQDIGTVGPAGSATYANGVFTVKGAGASGMWSTADGFHFVYQQMTGDGSVVARITSITSTASSTGVQIRESLDPNSKGAYLYSYNNGIGLNYRSTTGGVASNPASMSVTLPYWVKLTRSGTTVTAYTSVNGSSWSPLGSPLTISMANTIYVGLGTASGNTTSLATGTLDSVSVSSTASPAPLISSVSATTGSIGSQVVIFGSGFGATQGSSLVTINNVPMTVSGWNSSQITATVATGTTTGPLVVSVAPSMNDSNAVNFTLTSNPLPPGWLDQDIGTVGPAGSATYANGVFTVKGAGASGMWSTADGFHFVYQQMTGDGSVVARITSITSTASSTGVQIRESLDPNSKGAYLYSYNNGIGLNYRSTTGGVASNPASMSVTLPYWVKLTRSGTTVTAYTSVNGSSWSPLGSPLTISMANTIYVGLGTASGNTTSLATGTLDSVSVSSTASPAPLISSVSATTGSIGSQVVILASGFGATQGSSLVTINNVPMTVSGWNSSQITATVATGTTTGPLVVSVAPSMNDSNAVNFTLTSNPLPPGWLDQDIGTVGPAGSATYANGVFTVKGAGASGMWSTADGFHFVYQQMTGDGSVVARITSITSTASSTGVQI